VVDDPKSFREHHEQKDNILENDGAQKRFYEGGQRIELCLFLGSYR
jgi:hypothetical protein